MPDGNPPQRAAQPLAFSDTIGLFMPAGAAEAPARLAVLFASPWGLEELSMRKLWRVTAEKLAGHGIPSLRFDYPGTGDALDPQDGDNGLATWVESLVGAAEKLKVLSGCGRIAIIAEGLGCVIAAKAAASIEGVEAMAFLAPVVSGRMHLRELALWSSVVDDNLGLAPHQRSQSGVSIGSLIMPTGVADELRRINLMTLDVPPASRILVASRPERPSDGEFAARLGAIGADVSECGFNGYQALVANPTTSVLPLALVEEVVTWISALPVAPHPAVPMEAAEVGQLTGRGFVETPVRFGGSDHLVGILCEPSEERQNGTAVLFLTSAYDRHSGWGRSTVGMARQLARSGIVSLRFDTAGVADSPRSPVVRRRSSTMTARSLTSPMPWTFCNRAISAASAFPAAAAVPIWLSAPRCRTSGSPALSPSTRRCFAGSRGGRWMTRSSTAPAVSKITGGVLSTRVR
ncbi:hypothetical protein N7E02_14465 [Aliirhizobium terrae]|uniref:alpha/beta hydrolase n=1 Tax=Terrirhizobium terrae TaxID=2926709 RepID=UPI0025783258|nr:hypothetical protein [Rhizobium sp. CC-CFT758]WJH41544.1 hypothetical protein N7E02_14465 [Rhizobium sp. CC-CFT758]